MKKFSIKVQNLSKIYHKGNIINIFASLVSANRGQRKPFYALNDLSFEVRRGETIAIIGPNGAGKTTLLKILCGVTQQTSGYAEIVGKKAPLIEVGAGFHPDLTGRENIYLSGAIMGMSRNEIKARFDDIVDFAEIWDFIDTPVKNYSSGMFVRLGFSVAIHTEPDVLLVDEVLAVGDYSFQWKCFERMKEFKHSGRSIVLVSHNLNQIRKFCPRVLWLQKGCLQMDDTAEIVTNAYVESINRRLISRNNQQTRERFGNYEAEITSVMILDDKGIENDAIDFSTGIAFKINYIAHKKIALPNFGIGIFTEDGIRVTNTCTSAQGCSPEYILGSGSILCRYDILPLMPGRYMVTVAIKDHEGIVVYDRREGIGQFYVRQGEAWREESEHMGIFYKLAEWILDV